MELLTELKGVLSILRDAIWNPGFPRCAHSVQSVAASATLICAGDNPVRAAGGGIKRIRFVPSSLAAAGESMAIDVRARDRNSAFTSLLNATFTYDSTKTDAVYELDVAASILDPSILGLPAAGVTFEVVRTYVAGGGPTMTATGVFIDYYGDASP